MSLAGKNVLITGAARGIGAATARHLAARGARLALVGLEPDKLAKLTAELHTKPGARQYLDSLPPQAQQAGAQRPQAPHVWAEADVTDSAAMQAAVAQSVATLGGLDAVVANAGIASVGTVRAVDPEAFARTVDVNLTGVFRTVHASLQHLIASRGYLLIVSSLAALVPTVGFSAYGASKAGVEAFTDALRIELAPLGVSVGCAYMSWVDTDMIRHAERDLPTFQAMRARLPWPLHSTTSAADCAAAFGHAIQRRSRRVNVPRVIGVGHWIRPLLHSRLVDMLSARISATTLPKLEAELGVLGKRAAQLQAGRRH